MNPIPGLLALTLGIAAAAGEPPAAWRTEFAYERSDFAAEVREQPGNGGVKHFRVTYPSPVETVVPENNTVHAHLLEPAERTGASVIILPIWKGRGLDLELMVARRLASRGITAMIVVLPYQFDRAPEGKRTGELTVSSDLERTKSAVVQAVKDVKRAAQWLEETREADRTRMGIMGTSLGGHIAGLIWATDRSFRAGATVLAGGNIHELFWNGSNETRDIKKELQARGVTLADLAAVMKPYDPATWATPERGEGLLMIGALDDPVVPMGNVRALRDAFGAPRLVTYPGTHTTVALRIADILDDLSGHFERELLAR